MVEDINIEVTIRPGPIGGHEAWLRHRLIIDRRAREVTVGEETTPDGPPTSTNYFHTWHDDPAPGQRRFVSISALWGATRRDAVAALKGLIEEWAARQVRVVAVRDGCGCHACRIAGPDVDAGARP